MVAAVIRFRLPEGTDWEGMRDLARQRARSYYQHLPGLRTKAFVVDAERGIYGGLYIWESRQQLDEFLESETFQGVIQKLGQQPEIEVFEVPAYIERGEVVEASATTR
jgi:hypothetical protein